MGNTCDLLMGPDPCFSVYSDRQSYLASFLHVNVLACTEIISGEPSNMKMWRDRSGVLARLGCNRVLTRVLLPQSFQKLVSQLAVAWS